MKISSKNTLAETVPLYTLPIGEVGISLQDNYYLRIHNIRLNSEEIVIGINLKTGEYTTSILKGTYQGPDVIHLPNATLIPGYPS